jgi:hypothetical protein
MKSRDEKELAVVIKEAAALVFKPTSFYPKGSTCFDVPIPGAVVAHSVSQAKHLRQEGWIDAEEWHKPLREREAIEASRKRAEAAERAIEDERRASEVQAALEAEKAKKDKPTPAQVAETHQQFAIRLAQTQAEPLEARRRRIHERFIAICDAFTNLRNSGAFDQLDGLAQEWLDLRKEVFEIRAKLDAIADELARQMANAN